MKNVWNKLDCPSRKKYDYVKPLWKPSGAESEDEEEDEEDDEEEVLMFQGSWIKDSKDQLLATAVKEGFYPLVKNECKTSSGGCSRSSTLSF